MLSLSSDQNLIFWRNSVSEMLKLKKRATILMNPMLDMTKMQESIQWIVPRLNRLNKLKTSIMDSSLGLNVKSYLSPIQHKKLRFLTQLKAILAVKQYWLKKSLPDMSLLFQKRLWLSRLRKTNLLRTVRQCSYRAFWHC